MFFSRHPDPVPFGAGNAKIPFLVKNAATDTAWLYHGDESYHAGIHRVRLTNLSSVSEQIATVTLTPGTRKLIPVAGDGGIYFQNSGNFLVKGDTGVINAGSYPYIWLNHIVGTAAQPIVIINSGGQVLITSTNSYGINMNNSQFIHITGTGTAGTFYGFKAYGVGAGFSARDSVSDYEIDHFEAQHVTNALLCKSDPANESPWTWRGYGWREKNIKIHDIYGHDIVGEGMYLINTDALDSVFYNGIKIAVRPVDCVGMSVYNNIIDSCGWDGIQIVSTIDADIYGNRVTHCGLINMSSQQAGIILGGRSTGKMHHNIIQWVSGEGIEIFAYDGGVNYQISVYNNLLAHIGYDPVQKQDGIAVDDRPDQGTQFNNHRS